jgi:hypothetical protein
LKSREVAGHMEYVMALTDRLAPKSGEIAAKVIDGEAIIINLTNGYYYSMDGTGAFIWEAIKGGCSFGTMVETVSNRYDVSVEAATSDIRALLNQLMHEELVTLADDEAPSGMSQTPRDSEKLAYKRPTMDKYGDMAHFFALDPPLPELLDQVQADSPS